MMLWSVMRDLRATKTLRVWCRRFMMDTMHVDAVGRVSLPRERTAVMRYSGGGKEERAVARRTATRIDEVVRSGDKVALMREALSLRIPKRDLSFLRCPM